MTFYIPYFVVASFSAWGNLEIGMERIETLVDEFFREHHLVGGKEREVKTVAAITRPSAQGGCYVSHPSFVENDEVWLLDFLWHRS